MKLGKVDRRLLTILLIVFVQMVGAAMIMPILPLYAQREFDMSPQVITLLGTAFFAAQFIAGPYLGRLSDKYGRVPVLIVSQIGTAISFLMLAFAPSVGILFLARIVDGITGGNIIVAQAYLTDITPRERRTEALGYIFAVFGLGFIIGPALGGILAAAFGPRVPYMIAAVVAGIVVLLTWFTLDESLTPEQREHNRAYKKASLRPGQILRNGPLVLMLIIAFVGQFGMGMLQSTFALFGAAVLFDGSSDKTVNLGIGLLLAVIGLSQFVTQAFLLRPLLRRYQEPWLVVGGNILRTFGFVLLAIIATPVLGALAGMFVAVGMALIMPPLQSMSTTTVDDELRGGVLGIYQSTLSLAIIFSSAIAGVIFARDPSYPFWAAALLSAVVMVPAVMLLRQYQNTPPKATPAAIGPD
ncbi:MAG: MFS transporter [Chloroflexota bacterium]|nr:MFS transporter [Chloroflexota bacterium]